MLLYWPSTRMQEQISNPAWIDRLTVKLTEHRIIRPNHLYPYMPVSEGSYIIVEGSCTDFNRVINFSKGSDIFHLTPVLDQSRSSIAPIVDREIQTKMKTPDPIPTPLMRIR